MSFIAPLHRKKERWTTIVFFFLSGILTASWASRIPDVQQKLGMNNASWGTTLLGVYAGLFAGLSISSWLIARYGTKRIMVLSCIGTAAMLGAAGLVGSREQLMAALFAFGGLRTMLNISANTQSIQVQKLYNRPIVSTFHGIWSGASFVAAGIGTLMIIGGVSPAVHFLAIGAAVIALTLFFQPRRSPIDEARGEKRPFFILPDRYLFLLGGIAFCGMLCEGAMFDWSVNYFEKAVNAPAGLVTTGYTAFIVTMALGRLAGDRATAAFGPFSLLITNGVLMAIGFLIAVFFPFLLPAALGFLLIGLGDSIIVPIIYSLAAQSRKMPPGYAITSVTMIGYGGFLLGPVLIGYTSEAWNMQWAFGIVSLFSLCITVLALWVRREKEAMDRTTATA
ncbi:MAG TPA: MFS transporter [Chitinophagaceae bacterium]